MQTTETFETLEPAEVAKQLKVNERTVRRWMEEGKMPGGRLPSGEWRVSKAQYDTWLLERQLKQGSGGS